MSNSQEQYIQSLKKIKETEEKVHSEIESHRKQIENEIETLNNELTEIIANTKMEGKKMVEMSLQQANETATKEANLIIKDAQDKSKKMSVKLDQEDFKQILDILLSGI